LPFVSTSLATFLLPSRDTGVQVYGTVANGLFSYNLALTNGASAGTLTDSDLDSEKDAVARVFVRPFLRSGWSAVTRLGLGVGTSYGVHTGTTDTPGVPVLRTYGSQTFFSFANDRTVAGTAVAAGAIFRVVPHATWSYGPVAAYGDWAHVEENVSGKLVTSNAFSMVASVVLTGEEAAPLSYIVPRRPFDLITGGFGTIVLVARAGRLAVSNSAFAAGLALPVSAMQTATVVGFGVNWYPISGFAVLASFGHMWFEAYQGAMARPPEDGLTVRFQMVL
jgi:phosphate-selective porin OprO and OprP